MHYYPILIHVKVYIGNMIAVRTFSEFTVSKIIIQYNNGKIVVTAIIFPMYTFTWALHLLFLI